MKQVLNTGGNEMKYRLLSSIFYESTDRYDDLYKTRYNSESTFHIPVTIKDNGGFVVLTQEIALIMQDIYKCNQRICMIDNGDVLPKIAKKFLVMTTLTDEIMLTNDIEGIYSTRKEITNIMQSKNKDMKVRLEGLVRKYQTLINDEEIPLENCEDIRALYDQLVSTEVEEEDKPDGKIFRKESVSVVSVTDKEKHKGVVSEKKIIKSMEECLVMLKNKDLPELVKIAVFHYMIGYIHPFYDGNGRLSRFISSYLLKNEIHEISAIRLSCSIKDDKKAYYDAFEACNNPKNKGDLTPFVQMFLTVIKKGLVGLEEKIKDAQAKIYFYADILSKVEFESDITGQLIFILVQSKIFQDVGLSIKELVDTTQYCDSAIRKALKSKEFNSYPIIIEKDSNKLIYSIDLDKLDEY